MRERDSVEPKISAYCRRILAEFECSRWGLSVMLLSIALQTAQANEGRLLYSKAMGQTASQIQLYSTAGTSSNGVAVVSIVITTDDPAPMGKYNTIGSGLVSLVVSEDAEVDYDHIEVVRSTYRDGRMAERYAPQANAEKDWWRMLELVASKIPYVGILLDLKLANQSTVPSFEGRVDRNRFDLVSQGWEASPEKYWRHICVRIPVRMGHRSPLGLFAFWQTRAFGETGPVQASDNIVSPGLDLSSARAEEHALHSSDPQFRKGLVAFYPFKRNMIDESGNGNDGQGEDVVLTFDRFGNAGNAYAFNGRTSQIRCGNRSPLRIDGDISVAVWVKLKYATEQLIIQKYYGPVQDRGWVLSTVNHGEVAFDGRDGSGVYLSSGKKSGIQDDKWHFLVGQRRGSRWSMFVDGSLVSSNDVRHGGSIYQSGELVIGAGSVPAHPHASGVIDDVRVYNRAITNEEIKVLYHEGDWAR